MEKGQPSTSFCPPSSSSSYSPSTSTSTSFFPTQEITSDEPKRMSLVEERILGLLNDLEKPGRSPRSSFYLFLKEKDLSPNQDLSESSGLSISSLENSSGSTSPISSSSTLNSAIQPSLSLSSSLSLHEDSSSTDTLPFVTTSEPAPAAGEDELLIDRNNAGCPIRAGKIHKILEALTSIEHGDKESVMTFVLTYRSFCSSSLLLELLQKRNEDITNILKEQETPYKQKVKSYSSAVRTMGFVETWCTNGDLELSLLEKCFAWVQTLLRTTVAGRCAISVSTNNNSNSLDGTTTKLTQLQNLLDERILRARVTVKTEMERKKPSTKPKEEPLPPTTGQSDNFGNFSSREIAMQFCLIDHEFFANIKPKELLSCRWTKPDKDKRAPNVLSAINRFNTIGEWTVNLIMHKPKPKLKANVIKQLTKIAWECMRQQNFFTSMAIFSGLNHHSVFRLTEVWKMISKARLRQLTGMELLFSSENNYSELRQQLKDAKPPCIPFLGLYLKDLLFIEDGNPSEVNGMINFGKYALLANVIKEIKKFQLHPYNISDHHQLRRLVTHLVTSKAKDYPFNRTSSVANASNLDLDGLEGSHSTQSPPSNGAETSPTHASVNNNNNNEDNDDDHGGSVLKWFSKNKNHRNALDTSSSESYDDDERKKSNQAILSPRYDHALDSKYSEVVKDLFSKGRSTLNSTGTKEKEKEKEKERVANGGEISTRKGGSRIAHGTRDILPSFTQNKMTKPPPPPILVSPSSSSAPNIESPQLHLKPKPYPLNHSRSCPNMNNLPINNNNSSSNNNIEEPQAIKESKSVQNLPPPIPPRPSLPFIHTSREPSPPKPNSAFRQNRFPVATLPLPKYSSLSSATSPVAPSPLLSLPLPLASFSTAYPAATSPQDSPSNSPNSSPRSASPTSSDRSKRNNMFASIDSEAKAGGTDNRKATPLNDESVGHIILIGKRKI